MWLCGGPTGGWLLSILAPSPKASQPPSGAAPGQSRRYADVALTVEAGNVALAQLGFREATLFRAARALGRFVAWGGLPRHLVEQALQEAGEAAGPTVAECRSTLRSALNWSIAHNQRRRGATAWAPRPPLPEEHHPAPGRPGRCPMDRTTDGRGRAEGRPPGRTPSLLCARTAPPSPDPTPERPGIRIYAPPVYRDHKDGALVQAPRRLSSPPPTPASAVSPAARDASQP